MMFEIPITEFKNLKIGNMENTDAGTGCTVFLFEKGAPAGLDVRGGGPASEESELLKPMAADGKDPCHCAIRWKCVWAGSFKWSEGVSGGTRYRVRCGRQQKFLWSANPVCLT